MPDITDHIDIDTDIGTDDADIDGQAADTDFQAPPGPEEGGNPSREMLMVPLTADELLPEKEADISFLMRRYVRETWEAHVPWLCAMNGQGPEITGYPPMDEAWMAKESIDRAAHMAGFERLAKLQPNDFRRRFRSAVKSESGTAMGKFIQQGIHLRIEQRRRLADQRKQEAAE